MEYKFEKLSGNKVKFDFTVSADEFEAAVQKAYLKDRSRIEVPGFRKGKAPRKMIEKMYGESIFWEDAIDEVASSSYQEAAIKEGIEPVDRPSMDMKNFKPGEEISFTMEVFVYPDVELGQYKGVEITRNIHTVEEKDILASIEKEQHNMARVIDVTDRALQNGDTANLDYAGSVDGVPFEGGTAEKQTLKIGSNTFIPGFEDQMIGMNIGEERDLQVKFPDEYHAEDLKGKDAVFHVKLNSISTEELPEINDDFASEVSDFDTLDEYKANEKEKLQKSEIANGSNQARSDLIEKVLDSCKVDIPDALIESKLNEMMEEMSISLQRYGISLDNYLKMMNKTVEEVRSERKPEAEKNMKYELVLDKIITEEAIEANQEKVNEVISGYAAQTGKSVDEFRATLSESQIAYLEQITKRESAENLIWNNAVITDEGYVPAAADQAEEEPKA